nr:hypothetical protein [Tanacetum cinerariifolium]
MMIAKDGRCFMDKFAVKTGNSSLNTVGQRPTNLVADETVYKEWKDKMKRAATTASSLDTKQDSGNINRTQSMATLNEPLSQGTGSGSGPRYQVTILGVQKLKLAPGNYVQWKSRIKIYIDTKPNHELIYYCLENPPYKLGWKDKQVPDSDRNLTTTTERVFETYKNVTQDIRDQLNAEAEVVQIILTGIDNDIYSTVDACPNACEMWKAIEQLKHGESINVQDLETNMYWEFRKFTSQDGESLESYYSRENLENSSNAITPDLPTEEPDNSLSMGDEHLSTISETESDEVIKSSVEDLVLILNFLDFNDDCTLSDDDSFEDIDYVEASPPNSELVGLEEVKDDILREKLLNINLLISKIESLNDNPTFDFVFKSPSPFPIPVKDSDSFFEKSDTSRSYSDNSLPEIETFSDHTKETSSGSTTTHANNSLPEYDSFLFMIEPDQDELTSVVMEDILGEPHVHVPNVLPTHPTLMLYSDFISFDDSLGSNLKVSFPSRTRNKIFDPRIFFEVQSKRFLSRDTFYISFIRNLLCPVIETLLPFSFENEDKVFNHGILSSNLLSHKGKITFDLSESPMMISGGDIPFLDDLFLHFYPL